jgi:hypothetical protein
MSSRLTVRTFRRCVLKPTEGVFLFHPRVMERLVRRDRGQGLSSLAIPSLGHYLIARPVFLHSLEEENPDALAVIEGLSLPDLVILLPTPSTQELADGDPERLLRRYWGWRFEAEVARAWQTARNDNQDDEVFGGRGLARRIGEPAFREMRELLEQDQRVVLDLDDDTLCRQFVGFVTYLRYFAPGTRAYFFPAIADWGDLDHWFKEGGLDLPPPRHSRRWPQLLVKSRPSGMHSPPDYEPELPIQLPFGHHDPDLAEGANTILPLVSKWSSRAKVGVESATDRKSLDREKQALWVETRCLEAWRQASILTRQPGWRGWASHYLTAFLAPIIGRWASTLDRRWAAPPQWASAIRLRWFRYSVRVAFRAEMAGRYGTALRYLNIAAQQYQQIKSGDASNTDPVAQRLRALQRDLVVTLINNLAVTWRLNPSSIRIFETWIQRLLQEPDAAQWSSRPSRLLDDLERMVLEGRTAYYRLQPAAWLWSRGQKFLRLGLPFQGPLKALRALNAARTRLNQLPWSGAEVAYFSTPLQTLGERMSQRLRLPLLPRLSQLLDAVGFLPADHAQRVARNLLQEQLVEIILRRWHLRFTDLRDAVSRNELRLPDSGWRDLVLGDRLAHFDRKARVALPGIYQPGEFYLKGLQQLSAPLFGSAPGRSITRFLLLPFGIAFISLEALAYLLSLIPMTQGTVPIVNMGSVFGVGAGLLIAQYTDQGRRTVAALGRGFQWLLSAMYQGLLRLLRWRRMAGWLRHAWVRNLFRYLLEPLLINLVLTLPLIGIAGRFVPDIEGLPAFLLILGFILGAFLRNSRAGRQIVDDLMTQLINFWRQVRHTLAIGLVRWVMDLFDWLMHSVEQGLHRVDEAVSHHYGEGRGVMTMKAVIGPLWRVLSYFIHFYAAVLVEPQINPIKHFPVVTVSHKLMLPFLPALTMTLLAFLDSVLPQFISLPLVTVTILLLPGLFGFLAWELRENWKLYDANHPDRIQPARFGPAGETLYTLLRRGFHSGALPKAFAGLRAVIAQENEQQCSIPQALRRAEAQLNRILESVQTFVNRELVFALVERSREAGRPVAAKIVHLEAATASLVVRIALEPCGGESGPSVLFALRLTLVADELCGEVTLTGPVDRLGDQARMWLEEETARFLERAAIRCQRR